DTHRGAPCRRDQRNQLLVGAPGQHHLHDLHRLLVSDPEPVDEPAGLAQALQHARDLGAAPMDEHGVHARALEEHQVVDHGVSTSAPRMAAAAAARSGDAAMPLRTTGTPPIHMSILSGCTPAPDRPTAAITRPQLGSPPPSAVFTSGDVITAVATRFASSLE